MKKVITIVILSLYISLTTVQAISLHFCHGSLQSLAIIGQAESCCQSSEAMNASCCEDVVIKVDVDSDHIYSQQLCINEPLQSDLLSGIHEIDYSEVTPDHAYYKITCREYPPPQLYKLNHSYLFYG